MKGGERLLIMWLIRILFIIIGSLVGYLCSSHLPINGWQGPILGLCFALVLVVIERSMRRVPLKHLLVCLLGLSAGLIAANLLVFLVSVIVERGQKDNITPLIRDYEKALDPGEECA